MLSRLFGKSTKKKDQPFEKFGPRFLARNPDMRNIENIGAFGNTKSEENAFMAGFIQSDLIFRIEELSKNDVLRYEATVSFLMKNQPEKFKRKHMAQALKQLRGPVTATAAPPSIS